MEKGSSPKKSPPQLSPLPISNPYSPNNNNNSPPDISTDMVPLSKDDHHLSDSPPRLKREVHTPPKLSPKSVKGTGSDQDEKETDERYTSPTPSVSSKKSGSPGQFSVGLDVLARWTDGLVYLGTILKVEEETRRCLVIFEDNSEYWVLFKDLQKGRTHTTKSEIICSMCEGGSSETPNEIVICDKCELGYHQLCHRPSIDSRILLTPDEPWYCRQCVFANSTKIGGALRRGPAAKVFQEVKKNLPYMMRDTVKAPLSNLHWDSAHKVNTEKCYCYCGGPGDWYLKMLQCCRCKQWFHEACVQCLDVPMMYGDRFYIFVCSVCNNGPEYLKRLPIKWVDLAHLVVYNLTLLNAKKYYDFETEIMPFLTEQWNNLQIPELEGTTRLEKQEHMLTALNSSKMKFACGREIKKKKNLWGLRVRTAPVPPTIVLPAVGQITDEVMNDLQMKGRKVVTFVPVPSTSPVPLMRKRGKKRSLSEKDLEKMDKQERQKLKDATTTQRVMNSYSANQAYKGYRGTDNFANLLNLLPVKKGQSVLDSIQPLESTFRCGGRGICTHKLQDELRDVAAMDANSQMELRRRSTTDADDGASTSKAADSQPQTVAKKTTSSSHSCSVCCTSPLCMTHSQNRRRLHKKKRRRKAKREPDSAHNSPAKSPAKSPTISPKKSSPIRTSFISQTSSPTKSQNRSPTKLASKSPVKSPTKSPVKSPLKSSRLSPLKSSRHSPLKSSRHSPLKSSRHSPLKSSRHSPVRSPPRKDLRSGGASPVGRFCVNGVNKKSVSLSELKRSVSSYFGPEGRLACGERYKVLGKRITSDGKVQYLIQWEGATP